MVLQPAEWPWKLGVVVMVIGIVDLVGSFWLFSLALTSVFPIVLFFLRLKHGFGTCSLSDSVGLSIFLSSLVFRSDAYSVIRKVIYPCLTQLELFFYSRIAFVFVLSL